MKTWAKGSGYIEHIKLSINDRKYILALFDLAYAEGSRDELESQREELEDIVCGG